MRQRLSVLGVLLLISVVVLGGVTGCERSADSRTSGATEAADTGATSVPPTGEEEPAPGQTVVSAAGSTGTSGQQVTPAATEDQSGAAGDETPAAPAATDTPETDSGTAPAATEPPPSGSASEPGVVWHTVKPNENLTSIARMYGTTVEAIVQANNIVNPSVISVGQELKISTTGGSTSGSTAGSSGATGCRIRHTVKPGEWVWQIARNYGVSPYDILSANGLTISSARSLYPGQELCIP